MLPPALPEMQSEFRPLINLLIYRSKLDDTASELAVRPYEPAGNLELVGVDTARPRAAPRAVECRCAPGGGDRRRGKRHARAYGGRARGLRHLVDICCELKGLEEAEKTNG